MSSISSRGKASSVLLISCSTTTSASASRSQSRNAGSRALMPLMLKDAIFMARTLGRPSPARNPPPRPPR